MAWRECQVAGLILLFSLGNAATIQINSDITTSTTWLSENTYNLNDQIKVQSGVTLTIQAGTTIRGAKTGNSGLASALIFLRGSRIDAQGTKTAPITFTTQETVTATNVRGLWGGVIICGNAVIAGGPGSTNLVEGLDGVQYGGLNNADNSGTMRYVRIWHGGADVAPSSNSEGSGNEINGLTLAGVGSATTIEYVEVAYNLDDGFEMFGGAVNLRYCSSIFNGDDAFDTDEGYQGKMQFMFALVDENGHHATEMDSMTGGDLNSQPRSFPQLYGATFISAGGSKVNDGLMRLREGTGGRMGNIILTGVAASGLQNNDCGSEFRSSTFVNGDGSTNGKNFLYFSENNILFTRNTLGTNVQFDINCPSPSPPWSNPTAVALNPDLISVPNDWNNEADLKQIDPRAKVGGAAYSNVDVPPVGDAFFQVTNYKGAFSGSSALWLDQWSLLYQNALLPAADVLPTPATTLSGQISGDRTLTRGSTYYLTGQTFVTNGATLSIEDGVTIKAYRQEANGKAPTLVIEKNSKINAIGTAASPITFTSVLPSSFLPKTGTWGGIIILGNAIITGGGTNNVEGLDSNLGLYGGNNDLDNSGVMRYVRVWYGGADIGFDPNNPEGSGNEINGITFAGVGSGTTVEYVEVAFNKDDGFEFFGGSVNCKYLSALFVEDDSFDVDEGYQGSLQNIFALVDENGDHAAEMDSKNDNQRRSFPRVYGATFIKAFHTTTDENGLVQIREGCGGQFSNMILTGTAGSGMQNNLCFSEVRTSSSSFNGNKPNFLWWSENNIINTLSPITGSLKQFQIQTSAPDNCIWTNPSTPRSRLTDPQLILAPQWNNFQNLKFIDPRPAKGGSAYQSVDSPPSNDNGFFQQVDYVGAFGSEIWLEDWSFLSDNNLLPASGTGVPESATILSGNIVSDTTLSQSNVYYLIGQVFVKSGATLTIEPGTTIKAYRTGSDGRASALVIEQGAKIMAEGTASNPITFTSAEPDSALPARGLWGGLIILGRAPITGGGTADIEGLAAGLGTYGGNNDADNSGSLKYVRVWFGGADIGFDPNNPENSGNEINGITFGGVGSGTTLEHVEVAYNKDDGFEFFGGSVNGRWLSALFCDDDAFDSDQGYQGNLQFIFALVDEDGDHAAEMDSKFDNQRRSYPRVSGATFIKSDHTTGTSNGLIQIREGGGGEFYNMILTGKSGAGLENNDCGSEVRTSTAASQGTFPNSLYWDANNIINTVNVNTNAVTQFKIQGSAPNACSWTPTGDPRSRNVNPDLQLVRTKWTTLSELGVFDPRPIAAGNSFSGVVNPNSDGFFSSVSYMGAFAPDENWLQGWSYLSENGNLPTVVVIEKEKETKSEDEKSEASGMVAAIVVLVLVSVTLAVALGYKCFMERKSKKSKLMEEKKYADNVASNSKFEQGSSVIDQASEAEMV